MKNTLLFFCISWILFSWLTSCKEDAERITIPEKRPTVEKPNVNRPKKRITINETPLPNFIALRTLPKSSLLEPKVFQWGGAAYKIPISPFHKRKINGMPCLYEHNFAFDTTINNCQMRLIEHRLSRKENVDGLLLKDVNFLIEFLVRKSVSINNRFPSDTIQDMGDMTFYADIENVEADKIDYRYIYSYFAGGGSSLKGNLYKQMDKRDFERIIKLPMNSNGLINIISDFPDVKD